ncbi:hypothetical protein CPB84DRAFT_1777661 [Gymnopilus junonius]|uniref:Uncharacterized protein n=1 Tax=Gymnopilus junonius TaxID=109634 RepID=A0A9P5NNJ9_GYMJU|nr:hypothetical protein CPB84DRAFT_1777661 [Gymnopilus junonius]
MIVAHVLAVALEFYVHNGTPLEAENLRVFSLESQRAIEWSNPSKVNNILHFDSDLLPVCMDLSISIARMV